jgi:hypothetical protein
MLGKDVEERQRVYHRFLRAYNMGSQAVHSGKIKEKNALELLQEVQSDAATILKTVIAAGDKIKPLDVALGKPFP